MRLGKLGMTNPLDRFNRLRSLGVPGLLAGLMLVTAVLVRPVVAELKGPTQHDTMITVNVTTILQQEHLSERKIDDEISQRTFKTFLRQLDPRKLYFTQADVDEFSEKEFKLDDMARNADVSMAYTIFNRFLKRVDERVKLVSELLDLKHDFTVDEEIVTDSDLTVYAKDDAMLRDKWRKQIKFELLVQKAEKTEGDEAIAKLRRRYQSLAKRMHQIDNDELLEMYITAMTSSFDPHTTYMSKSSYDNFLIMMRLELEGIGASLQYEDGYTKVKELIPGGAAEKDGRL
jgi:carboxyl-terminal processing protease